MLLAYRDRYYSSLSDNHILDEGVSVVARALTTNSTLTKLNLSSESLSFQQSGETSVHHPVLVCSFDR